MKEIAYTYPSDSYPLFRSSLQLYRSASRKNLHKQYAKGEDITLWS